LVFIFPGVALDQEYRLEARLILLKAQVMVFQEFSFALVHQ
jgi:hypothetical protein